MFYTRHFIFLIYKLRKNYIINTIVKHISIIQWQICWLKGIPHNASKLRNFNVKNILGRSEVYNRILIKNINLIKIRKFTILHHWVYRDNKQRNSRRIFISFRVLNFRSQFKRNSHETLGIEKQKVRNSGGKLARQVRCNAICRHGC